MQGFDSIAAIRQANANAGHYYFSWDTMRFFRSRVLPTVYGRRFFITSEQSDEESPRLYSVREANDDGSIETYGEFQGFKTRLEAVKAAKRVALERGVPEYDRALTLAEAAGRDAGAAAGSWVIDGNTTPEAAARIVRGYDDGDPEIMDRQPAPLSGEWADGLTPADVLEPLGRTWDDDDADDLLSAFENGYALGYWDAVLAAARALAEPEPEPEPEPDTSAHARYDLTRETGQDEDGRTMREQYRDQAAVAEPEPEPEPDAEAHGRPAGGRKAPCGCDWYGIRLDDSGAPLDCGCGWGDLCTADRAEPAESPRPADEDRAGGRNTMTRAASGDRATPEPSPSPSPSPSPGDRGYARGLANIALAEETPRGDAENAARFWKAAQFDHAQTSFYGADIVRELRAEWLGVLRLQRRQGLGLLTVADQGSGRNG